MSEIRFQNAALSSTYSPAFGVARPPECTKADAPVSPFVTQGGSLQLLESPGTHLVSNPLGSANLVDFQAQTAAAITNPSGAQSDSPDSPDLHSVGAKTSKGVKTAATVVKTAAKASGHLGRAAARLGPAAGRIGPAAQLIAAPLVLPGQISDATSSIRTAVDTGKTADIIKAGGDTGAAGSTTLKTINAGLDSYNLVNSSKTFAGYQARRSAGSAFRQAAPKASKQVVSAAARQAAQEALKDSGAKVARRATTAAATSAAKSGSTLARGAGVTSRAAARTVLTEGGEAAAKAASKAVAKSALKTGAKAAGRFVPGLNIGIAAMDTAVAGATLADPKASTGKKVTSVITAAGSIVAATNIPIVSQIGGAVSAVSSFVGAFF